MKEGSSSAWSLFSLLMPSISHTLTHEGSSAWSLFSHLMPSISHTHHEGSSLFSLLMPSISHTRHEGSSAWLLFSLLMPSISHTHHEGSSAWLLFSLMPSISHVIMKVHLLGHCSHSSCLVLVTHIMKSRTSSSAWS